MKAWSGGIGLALGVLLAAGCAVYTPRQIQEVNSLIREAGAAGARKKAAYEYYSAVEYLRAAKEELSEADDKSAREFGEKARARAEEALKKSR